VLVPGVALHGEITDPTGRAIAGASVAAEAADDASPLGFAVTGGDGRYQLPPVARDVTVRVAASGHVGAERTVRLGRPQRALQRREESFTLVVADAALRGVVVDPLGFAVSGARVAIAEPDLSGAREAVTDARGGFELPGVAAGEYRVVVDSAGFPSLTARLSTAEPARLELAFGGGIRVSVRDAHTGAPIGVGRVTADGPHAAHHEAAIASGGARLAPLRAGRWTVRAEAPGYAVAAVATDVPPGDARDAVTVAELRIELARGARIAGVVRDPHGARAHGARVRAGALETATDQDGAFLLDDVPAGDIRVTAELGDHHGETRIPLRPGDDLKSVEIVLE
jgi:hypothetical protein